MKHLVFLVFVSSTAFSYGRCLPKDVNIKTCKQFSANVLRKAVYEDAKASQDVSPYRFVQDEKQAVGFLNSYNPAELSLADQKCINRNFVLNCVNPDPVRDSLGCETTFDVLNFFRGLLTGVRMNGWTSNTLIMAEEVIKKHVNYVLSSEPTLLDTMISLTLIKEAQAQGLLKIGFKDASPFYFEGEKISQSLNTLSKDWKKPMSCIEANRVHQKEIELTSELIKKWKS